MAINNFMLRCAYLVVLPILLSGCVEIVTLAPPSDGRVIDAQTGRPIAEAIVTRTPYKVTRKTDSKGHFRFHGKHQLQVAVGDYFPPSVSYRVEAPGYQAVVIETSGLRQGRYPKPGSVEPPKLLAPKAQEAHSSLEAAQHTVKDHLGDIALAPK